MELHKFGLANELEVITNTAESKLCGELISFRPFLKVELKVSMFSLFSLVSLSIIDGNSDLKIL